LKELNVAYETARVFLQQGEDALNGVSTREGEHSSPTAGESSFRHENVSSSERSRTEIVAEAGTVLILNVCSYISKRVSRLLK